jgi:hypothetical protein
MKSTVPERFDSWNTALAVAVVEAGERRYLGVQNLRHPHPSLGPMMPRGPVSTICPAEWQHHIAAATVAKISH